MDLAELQRHWDQFGKDDPLWAILTTPDKKHGRWDLKEFFAIGRDEIDRMLGLAERSVGRAVPRSRAMDFGCGVGRLTQALCARFARADGVDIAASMIDGARRLNQHGERCEYHLNRTGDLRIFEAGTFDFVYTAHVLQHMEPRFAKAYVAEFVRTLAPEGVLLFEITTERVTGATGPLPDDAFQGSVRILDAPTDLDAGRSAAVGVEVTNTSSTIWPASGKEGWYQVTLGNHWAAGGRRVTGDDARTPLPHDIEPGATERMELEVTAPPKAGQYELEVDLCQEAVAWFGDRGMTLARAPVTVRSQRRGLFRRGSSDGAAASEPATMEMYGTPEAEVEQWITEAGGRLVEVVDWEAEMGQQQSPDWHRRGFVVTR